MTKPLLAFALKEESAHLFDDHQVLYTGVGKVQACLSLTRAIDQNRPDIVINLGTAGASADFKAGDIVNAVSFIQRDMDATGLGFEKFQTPFSDIPVRLDTGLAAKNLPQAVCGSGDNFSTTDDFGAGAYGIVDMEAYALASVCQNYDLPFLCLKYISDGADGEASQDWDAALKHTAQALHAALDQVRLEDYL